MQIEGNKFMDGYDRDGINCTTVDYYTYDQSLYKKGLSFVAGHKMRYPMSICK